MIKLKDNIELKELNNYGFKEYKKFYKRRKSILYNHYGSYDVETKIYKRDKSVNNRIISGFYKYSADAVKGINDIKDILE